MWKRFVYTDITLSHILEINSKGLSTVLAPGEKFASSSRDHRFKILIITKKITNTSFFFLVFRFAVQTLYALGKKIITAFSSAVS